MRLTFLGGADEVGASSTLIEIAGKRLLVDVGIRISAKSSRGIEADQLPDLYPISERGGIDYVLVTHAHTDHTGALPLVIEQYPHIPVLATAPTIALVRVLQADAQRIMKSKQDEEGELPLFDELAVERLLNAFQEVAFRQAIYLGDGLQVTYYPSGHILGAALLVIESDEGTLVMSGDVSKTPQRTVVSAELPRITADVLVLESTYGGKLHANRLAEEKRLVETLRGIIERGGKALIPAFALGRAQEVLQILLAYRDQLDVPVYADGMVRAVCTAYSQFTDLLPAGTVQAAGTDPLFFRNKVKAVQSRNQREEMAQTDAPAIIVASSGMLTGGPSAFYAQALAGDARNAILLTGYQDEEAPGRVLQRMARERQDHEEVAFRIGTQTVSLRCTLDTYSLSAHADESELVSMAEALGADQIALVHGEPTARNSLAVRLRERQKRVLCPVSGQSYEFAFERRAWKVGTLSSGVHNQPVDPAVLWATFRVNAGSFYSAAELARVWWGDQTRANEMTTALIDDGVYFAQDWRQHKNFKVRDAEQVALAQRQRAIMLAYPNLIGQLIVLRDSNHRTRVGVVVSAGIDSFEAVVLNAKGRQYPADALVWIVGSWIGSQKPEAMIGRLVAMVDQAKAVQDTLLPFERREVLVAQAQPVDPADLLPAQLPSEVAPIIAKLSICLALAEDGATLEPAGLLPQRVLRVGPMEMNQARETALAAFPAQARLRKVGMEIQRKRLTLTFDFPGPAKESYREVIDNLGELTGWEVSITPEVNQQALGAAISELLPPGGQIIKGPSFYLAIGEVHAEVTEVAELERLEQDYLALTGFVLRLNTSRPTSQPLPALASIDPPSGSQKMEINAAYALIQQTLMGTGLYKVSLKQGQIVLSFISPQVGQRYRDEITRLSAATGYVLAIHPHPNQNDIILAVSRRVREAGWQVRKGPSLHIERAEVALTLAQTPEGIEHITHAVEQETGYRLVFQV